MVTGGGAVGPEITVIYGAAECLAALAEPFRGAKAPGRVRPHEVFIKAGEGGVHVDSVAQATQIRTIDRHVRVQKVLGQLEAGTMAQIALAMLNALGGCSGGRHRSNLE